MSDLDDTLFEILVGGSEDMPLDTKQLARKRKQYDIEQIKQAFKDEGFIPETDHKCFNCGANYYLIGNSYRCLFCGGNEAAKKASGIAE